MKIYLLSILILICAGMNVYAQRFEASCSAIEYEDSNEVNPNPLVIKRIAGQVFDNPLGGPKNPISAVCMVLFEEKTKKRVAIGAVDKAGNFKFRKIANGNYRLIVASKYNFYCPANIPLKIDSQTTEDKKITVHMLLGPIDACSYGDLN